MCIAAETDHVGVEEGHEGGVEGVHALSGAANHVDEFLGQVLVQAGLVPVHRVDERRVELELAGEEREVAMVDEVEPKLSRPTSTAGPRQMREGAWLTGRAARVAAPTVSLRSCGMVAAAPCRAGVFHALPTQCRPDDAAAWRADDPAGRQRGAPRRRRGERGRRTFHGRRVVQRRCVVCVRRTDVACCRALSGAHPILPVGRGRTQTRLCRRRPSSTPFEKFVTVLSRGTLIT